jgi:hypothetical protein
VAQHKPLSIRSHRYTIHCRVELSDPTEFAKVKPRKILGFNFWIVKPEKLNPDIFLGFNFWIIKPEKLNPNIFLWFKFWITKPEKLNPNMFQGPTPHRYF